MGIQSALGNERVEIILSLDQNFFHIHRIKIAFIGKWYSLPENLVSVMKKLMEDTKEYDNFFLNFCMNYDGKQEIVDACKLITIQVKSEKLESENINEGVIKENIANSYFLPPDLIVFTEGNKTNSFLLWDSCNSRVLFFEKPLREFGVSWLKENL